nr:zinc finger, CCHC-type [Tanacetum cinerariifolium]
AKQELFETFKAFHACKKEEGQSVSTYVLKMKAYLDQMERLGYPMPLVLGVNIILTLLSKDYDQFVQNYNMHSIGKIIPELHAMLKLEENGIPKKALAILAIRQGQIQKPKLQAQGKGKSKLAYDLKHKIPPPVKKEHPAKDTEYGVCHHNEGGAIDWKSSKQSTTAMSSMEAEYIAAAEAAMEAIWIRKFISEVGVVPNIDRPMDMCCDNTSAITIADEPGVQKGAKYF